MRLLLFADSEMPSSVALVRAGLRAASRRDDTEIVAVVDTTYAGSSRRSPLRAIARAGLRAACNVNTSAAPDTSLRLATCESVARRFGAPVLVPGPGGVNDDGFVAEVRALAPDAALNLMAPRIFRAPLLAACKRPVNYHDGLLPDYQGVRATSWSIYRQERESGFSFHVMTEAVDQGPIVLQGSVPLDARSCLAPVEHAKTRLACSKLDDVLDLLWQGSDGFPRASRPGSRFSRADLRKIREAVDPRKLTLEELELRLRAFEVLELTIDGVQRPVTALRRARGRRRARRSRFATADGIEVEPSRVSHLPVAAYGRRPRTSAS